MSSIARSLALAAGLMLATTSHAQSQDTDIRGLGERVTGDDLYASFAGVTHEGAYNFNLDGVPRSRYSEAHNTDGTTDYIEGDLQQKGAWVLREDRICFWYPDLNSGCFRVWRVDNCYYYYSDQFPESADELSRNYWTARSVKRGENATCEARFT